MSPGTTIPQRLFSVAAVAALVASFAVVGAERAEAGEIACSGDSCDEGAWAAARGAANELSYWGMSPGHNCTNYVAWRLIQDGAQRPANHPGNASTWAVGAKADGYPVDKNPTVGSIAQWDSFAGGNGIDGHVAYVEKVNDDGTILVSEDYWHDGSQLGPLTYRVVDIASVSNFIHYLDASDWLRTASVAGDGWISTSTGLSPEPAALTALALDGASPIVYYSEAGKLMEAAPGATGWVATDTGVRSESTSLSAVSMDGTRPYVMSLDNEVLVMTVKTASGWQRMSTGFQITGEISAVNFGGLWPTVYLSQGGALWRIWGDNEGWHSEPTNVEVWGPISAIINEQGWPEVFNVESGMIFRSWLDESGWKTESTGIPASGSISAVSTPSGTQVILVQDGTVFRIVTDGHNWTKWTTGIRGGLLMTALDLGDSAPEVIQVGHSLTG